VRARLVWTVCSEPPRTGVEKSRAEHVPNGDESNERPLSAGMDVETVDNMCSDLVDKPIDKKAPPLII
jgi:hypothetical protein